jgi:hypothetical protein
MSLRWSSATDQLYAVSNSSPSLDLDFASNKSLLDNISGFPLVNHQRDASSGKSAGTYVDSDGLIKTSPVNYAINSEQIDLWTPSGGSISANFAESPIGDLTADKWIPDTASSYHYPKLITTLSSASSVTYSIYAKQAGYRYLLINTTDGSSSGNGGPVVDLQDGEVASNYTATYPTTVTDAGNGWWRVAMTFTGNGVNIIVDHNPLPTSTIAAYSGDNTSGVLLWGAQLQEGTTATDYIPTGATISGAPRFDHDPVTGESLGLLIEEERTNYCTGDFNGTLGDGGLQTLPSGVKAPDGSTAAYLLLPGVTRLWFDGLNSVNIGISGKAVLSYYAYSVNNSIILRPNAFNTSYTNVVSDTIPGQWVRIYAVVDLINGVLQYRVTP